MAVLLAPVRFEQAYVWRSRCRPRSGQNLPWKCFRSAGVNAVYGVRNASRQRITLKIWRLRGEAPPTEIIIHFCIFSRIFIHFGLTLLFHGNPPPSLLIVYPARTQCAPCPILSPSFWRKGGKARHSSGPHEQAAPITRNWPGYCCCCICCKSRKGWLRSGGCWARSTSTLQSSGMGILRSRAGGCSLASTCTAT